MVNFRKFVLSSGREIFGGKDSASNDELVWKAGDNDILAHTFAPGSPFVNVGFNPLKKEVYEAAVFCAKFSQAWRDTRKDVIVNVFRRSDMKKNKRMKKGSWKVSKEERVKVKKGDILKLEEKMNEAD